MPGVEGLVERWRELGPVLWLVAAAGVAAWALLLGGLALATRPREVDPAPATLDPGGPEPPAVVNLLTAGWRLGHESVPATLLDLGARRLLHIDQVGTRTLVRVRGSPTVDRTGTAATTAYERMVLDHVAHRASDGVVPAEALTTGPEAEARGWWRRFRRAVERDAQARGLSRRRWSPAVHATLTVGALAVAALVALAATTLPDDPDDPDDDPLGAALAFGGVTAVGLVAAVEAMNGQRDTPAGRAAAARWLGLRSYLAEDPMFAEYPPAGVAIWDRLLAYGAAMGVAHGAVRAIPLGAESDREAWSPVGGHWRVVRVRYPRFLPPGYGRPPAWAALAGLFQLGLAALAFPAATAAAPALLDLARDFSDGSVPLAFRLFVTGALAVVVVMATGLALRGGLMLAGGVADLLSRPRTVEGRVLRVRRRGGKDKARWYVAVDDGTADRVRAWQAAPRGAAQGATVRATVTRWLAHVRDLTVVTPPAAAADGLAAAGEDGDEDRPAAPIRPEPLPAPAGPPPPLPTPDAVAAATGLPLDLDPAARPHPLALPGASATFSGPGRAMVQVAWVGPQFLQAQRALPRFLRREVPGLGDEAYRATIGGGIVARQSGWVVLVLGTLPGLSEPQRDHALEEVARAAIAGA
jgi:hypothetical protein